MSYQKILSSIEELAKKAGLIMLEAEDIRHQIKEKSGHANFVTVYDERVQEYLFKELKKIIPDASFVGEEEGAEIFKPEYEQGYTFCIDPIDGTSNFLTGYQPSVISIALFKDGNPYVSVVYEPYQDLLFTAVKGEGAFLNGKQLESSREPLARSLVSFGTSPYDPELMHRSFELCKIILPKCIDLRRSGSAVWDICQVAMGVTGMFFECKLRLWDFAAASLILEEAGGRIIDMNGEKLSLRGPSSILAISQGVAAEGLKRLDF
ncbi:MAG: inositol monophosphatase [Firmicutes bacterium]|nr:inositol monophosphatase [Bacillota bacterium]